MTKNRSTALFAGIGALAFLAAGVLIAVSLAGGKSSKAPAANAPLVGVGDALSIFGGIPQHGITLGKPNAPVTVAEYADLQCPYCGRFATDELPTFVRQYVRTGKAKIEFRGLAFVGPQSLSGLRTAIAAGQQGKLWQLVDIVYANQGSENSGWLSDGFLHRVGHAIPGLDAEKLPAARDSAAVKAVQASNEASATTAGVNSTPTLFVGRTGGTLSRVDSATAAALARAVNAAS